MLKLDNIVKEYPTGDSTVTALKGVSIEFRENEFVSILGPSGCGKTTLLNIIGGLDHYTEGDLIINNVSTKKYKDRDWDSYRNHSIGFVFQSYNLIPHQTVLANVELALTLSGVSRKERKQRAIAALEKVGLGDQLKKKPNQMSGGQMQRVAIARALVNNPDILLADEPTGALDTDTSAQVMDILAEVAEDKLVIMVTHNPELAQVYSTRIIRLLDGNIVSDSMPVVDESATEAVAADTKKPDIWAEKSGDEVVEEVEPDAPAISSEEQVTVDDNLTDKQKKAALKKALKEERKAQKKAAKAARPPKTSMKRMTALSLSLNNLMTKKARTFLTAFAGSIGIIGISLILSMSNGVQLYINKVEEDTLSSYPITIEKTTIDMTSFMTSMQNAQSDKEDHEQNKIYTNQIMTNFMKLMVKEVSTNNLSDFKKFIDNNSDRFKPLTSDIHYGYSTPLNVYRADIENGVYQVNPGQVFAAFGMGGGSRRSMFTNTEVWQRLINNNKLLEQQYEVLYGKMPEKFDEVVLIVSGNNEVTDYTLYSLGILDSKELSEQFMKLAMGEEAELPAPRAYSFEELASLKFKLLLNSDYFEKIGDNWVDRSDDELYLLQKLNNATEIKIVGIIKSTSEASNNGLSGIIGYRTDLMEYLIGEVNKSDIVIQQKANPDVDVFSGLKFEKSDEKEIITQEMLDMYIASLPEEEKAQTLASIDQMKAYGMSDEKILETFSSLFEEAATDATYEDNLKKIGVSDPDDPRTISLYPKDFESKDKLSDLIKEYNEGKDEDEVITYTDYIGLILSSVSTIINAISYILIAFVAISLVVSSIMIGIITYISVLERTKEIGILRAIGASKKDISRVFNAETLIVGFTAGALGILISWLMLFPINAIIYKITDISGIAVLPYQAAIILILISMFLTFIAGLFPSKIAARKDPVVALRSE